MPAPPRRRLLVAGAILTLLFAGFLVATPAAGRRPADLPGQAGHRLLGRERRHPGLGRRRRQRRHPLVERVQPIRSGSRSTSAPTAAIDQVVLRLGGRLRDAPSRSRSPPTATAWTDDLLDHHRRPAARRPWPSPAPGATSAMNGTARATGYGYSLWEFQVFGTTGGGGPADPPPAGGTPISAFKQVAASSWEGGNAPAAALDGRTTTRWSSVVQRSTVDAGRPRRHRPPSTSVVLNWEGAYATGVPARDLGQRHHLDDDLHHHHRPRRRRDARRHRHRPVRADVRHRPGDRLRLLAVGVPGRSARWTPRVDAAAAVRADPPAGDHGPVRADRPGRRRDGHHHPASGAVLGRGRPARRATRSGSTSAAPTTTSPRPAT